MRRFRYQVILAVALCLTLKGLAAASAAVTTAYKANVPIVVDGKLDEWKLDAPIIIEDAGQVIRDADFWQGPTDLSCQAYVMWDENNLYLAADITEDTPFGVIDMLPLEQVDNLKLYISTDPAADPERTAYGTNDFVLYLVMDNQYWDTAFDRSMVDREVRQRFNTRGIDGGENVLEGYECAVQRTTTGFIYEAIIPWANFSNSNIPVYVPQAGDEIKFNLAITDIAYPCPGTEYVPQMAWTGDLRININPSLWGTLIFAE